MDRQRDGYRLSDRAQPGKGGEGYVQGGGDREAGIRGGGVMLTYGSLFSGVGGFDLGFDRAGMRCEWQVEIDDYARRVLKKHWPDVPKHKDVRNVGRKNLKPVDVICGGFPCQPHSLAGKQKGAADDRHIWPEYFRIVTELNPAFVVGENVPGLIHTELDNIISDLEGAGYEVATFDIPACGVGANHRRHRLFIVAYCHGRGLAQRGPHKPIEGDGRQLDGNRNGSVPNGWRVAATRQNGSVAFGEGHRLQGNRASWQQVATSRRPEAESKRGQAALVNPNVVNRWAGSGPPKREEATDSSWWAVEPGVGRVANGVPSRVDRLKCLGNAVVPQVAEFVGRMVVQFAEAQR